MLANKNVISVNFGAIYQINITNTAIAKYDEINKNLDFQLFKSPMVMPIDASKAPCGTPTKIIKNIAR